MLDSFIVIWVSFEHECEHLEYPEIAKAFSIRNVHFWKYS